MSEILSVNSLDGYTQPRMVYRFAFGAASKSYTITLPATPRNVVALAGKIRQRATLTIDSITQIGWLLLTSEDTTAGVFEVVFVSGNGDLWQRRVNDKLSDVNLSEFDFTYDRTTVNDSETAAAPFVLFDVADRGAFRTPDAIDITERYPALRVATLTDRVFRHLGTSPVVEDRRGDWGELYLLFTQSNEVRGTADWARDAIMRAYDDSYDQQNNTQGAGAMTWSYTAELTEVQDVGGNYSDGVYLVPQDGTYTFRVNFNRLLGTFEDDMGSPASLSYDSTANRARVTVAIERNGSAISRWRNIETVTAGTIDIGAKQIDLHPIELTNGDEIRVRVTIEATVSFPSGGTQSRFAVGIERAELTNTASRWYGAGSQVAVRDIVPDMTVNEYIRWMVEVLGVEVYHDQLAARTYVRYGGIDQTPAARVENYERLTIGNDAPANVQLIYRTDKAAPPPNEAYIIDESLDTEREEIPVSRTRFARCGRLLGYNYGHEVPTLWQAGNPLDQSQATMPPAHQTTAAMRVVRRLPNAMAAVSFRQTFAGSVAQTEEIKTRLVRFAEVDHWQLLAPRALRVRQTVELVARVNVANLIGGSWFRRPLHVAGQLVELIEAEQLNGDVYRLRGATLALYSGVQRVELPVTTVPDTTPRGGGGGGVATGGGSDLPSDVWRSSTSGQVSGLPEKTTPATGDSLLLDDSAAANAKKRVTWGNIRSALQTFFNSYYYAGGVTGQIYSTNEKTTLANNDVLLIEDSGASYAKRSSKLTTLRDYLYNFFYGAQAGQFAATPEKTSLADDDRFIIEDSSASNAKKSLKASAFVLWRKLAGVWTASAPAVISTDSVTSSAAFEVYNTSTQAGSAIYAQAAYGYAAMLHSSGFLPAIYARSIPTSTSGIQTVMEIVRRTSGTATNNIAGEMKLTLSNSAGDDISPASIVWRLTDATAGSAKGELDFVVNMASRVKISDTNKLELQSGSDIEFKAAGDGVILKAENGTRYKVTVNNSGTLVVTAV